MRSPMILPWIARRNGLSPERAAALWDQAVTLADFHVGPDRNTPEYWRYAVESLLKLARCEGRALAAPPRIGEPNFVRLLAWQQLAGQIGLNTVAGLWRIGATLWSPRERVPATSPRAVH